MCFYFIVIVIFIHLVCADQPKIVIIGAGASGIAAASRLYEYGFDDVTILEARNRIGGRIFTTRFDNNWIDLGAEWVHGEENNTVYKLAAPLGILEVPEQSAELRMYTSKGIALSEDVNEYASEVYWYLEHYRLDDAKEIDPRLGSQLEALANDALKKFPKIDETLRNQLIHTFDMSYAINVGANGWNEISVTNLMESWHAGGSFAVNWMGKGYGLILDILMRKYPNPAEELPVMNNTLLNVEVTNVNYGLIENKVVVKTTTGQRYIADHVIVTPSLGVLKARYKTLFTPSLPEWKVKNIEGLAFGSVAKLYFSFESPWWNKDMAYYTLLWDEEDKNEYESNPDTKWLLDISVFATVDHKPKLLCGWVRSSGARYMETLSEEQTFNQSFALLNKFLGQSYNITRPVAFLRTTWHSDKYFRGTYSYRNLKSDRAQAWAEELSTPLVVDNKPIVQFAGEATHPHYFSTAHGAIETGFREANRLKELYADALA